MSYENWLNYLKSADIKCELTARHRRVHYKFADKQEMLEEYNLVTGVLEKRAWKRAAVLSKNDEWELELGEMKTPVNNEIITLHEAATSPSISKRITRKVIEWRIRNLPYDLQVYQVRVNPSNYSIIVSTSNKKYYKILKVQELERCQLKADQTQLTVHHQHNTLIITYCKPQLLNELEDQINYLLKEKPVNNMREDLMDILTVHQKHDM